MTFEDFWEVEFEFLRHFEGERSDGTSDNDRVHDIPDITKVRTRMEQNPEIHHLFIMNSPIKKKVEGHHVTSKENSIQFFCFKATTIHDFSSFLVSHYFGCGNVCRNL